MSSAARLRRLALIGTPAALLVVLALGVANYREMESAVLERAEERHLGLARTAAVGIGAELAGHAAGLAHLAALPSVQRVDRDFLPGRLREFFASPHLPGVQEILRVDEARRLWRWRAQGTSLTPLPEPWDDEPVWRWARDPASRGTVRAFVREGEQGVRLLLAMPVYETASSDVVRSPSGRLAGFVGFSLDPGTLSRSYLDALQESLPAACIELYEAGRRVLLTEGGGCATLGVARDASPAEAAADGSRRIETRGGAAIESRTSVEAAGRALQVRMVVPRAWVLADVRGLFRRDLALFLALVLTTLGAGWALLRVARAEMRYRQLLERAAEGVFVLDRRGIVEEANAAAAALTGLPTSTLASRPFESLLDEPGRATWRGAERVAEGASHAGGTLALRHADGSAVPTEFSVSCDARGRRLVLLRDVRDRNRLEEQLRHAQKTEALGRLAGGIAHDFNNLLTAIGGYNDLLLESLEGSDPRREDAWQVRRAVERAAALTRQLLAVGRRQVLRPRTVDLNALVGHLEGLLRRVVGEHITLRTSLSPDLWPVEADPGQIEQVVINLVVNARDAMADGGEILVETSNLSTRPPFASDTTPAPGVRLSVVDSGSGMDASTLARVFEPFFTTKPFGQGSGLGLPTAQGIVQQSRGDLLISSAPGAGTRVDVVLPPAAGAGPPADAEREPARVPAPAPAVVLLVEDDATVRRFTGRVLEGLGYQVREADGAECALEWLRSAGAPPDVLVTDVVMPGMNGAQLAAAARLQWPHLPVIFVSGYSEEALGARGVLQGVGRLLTKPFTADQLSEAVRETLEREGYV